MLLSQLKPVAACSLGHPETGEMFVVTNRDAGDATCLILTLSLFSARLLGSAVYDIFCLCCSKSHENRQS